MKKIQDADIGNKTVLLRADFNVAIKEGVIAEKFKIQAAKETLDYLLARGAKVAIISHLGRPEGQFNPDYSFKILADGLGRILGVKLVFVPDCIGEKVAEALGNLNAGEALLLENVRFYEGDEKNEREFSEKLAKGFGLYVNDAFSVSHRDHASVTGVAAFCESFAGFQLQKELTEMEKAKNSFDRPAVAIIGGAKIETKLPVIKFFEEKYDQVLVGGKIANEALDQKIGFSDKVVLPADFTGDRLDIGQRTIERFRTILGTAKTIVWNGPLGKFEEEAYAAGTYSILDSILEIKGRNGAYVMIGGGETLEALEKRGAIGKPDFVSTGGGAMLEYLGGGQMPGIEILG